MLVENGSDNFYVDCSYSTDYCDVSVDNSENILTPTAENTYNVEKLVDCSFSKDCILNAISSRDIYLDCSNSDSCTVDINTATNSIATWYSANVINAKSNLKPDIQMTNVDRVVIDCNLAKNCKATILDPSNFLLATCNNAIPVYHKVNF